MGADCTRSYQAELTTPNYPQQLKSNKKPLISSSIYIQAFTVAPNKTMEASKHSIKHYAAYLTLSDKAADDATFIPQFGFKKYKKAQEQQKDEYDISFQFRRLDNNTSKLELKLKQDLQLWKKIPQEKVEMYVGKQLCVGSQILRLRHLLNPEQINTNKLKSQIKLSVCPDTLAECRICLQKAQNESNQLIMPCKCTGSVSAVHQVCLSDWIFGQKVIFSETTQIFCFKIKHGQCQICKEPFQNYIWNRMMKALSSFNSSYAIFQLKHIMDKQQKTKDNREYMILKLQQKETTIKIGNTDICQICFPDNMLSEINTILTYKNRKLLIEDNNSKFGTYLSTSNRNLEVNNSYRLLNLFFNISKETNTIKPHLNKTK